MTKTKIPYLDYVWNITKGCSPKSSGCKNCYAKKMAPRLASNNIECYDKKEPFKPVFCRGKINDPCNIKKPSVIGVSFMGDLFHDEIHEDVIIDVLTVIRSCKQHKFVLCTKRPERMYYALERFIKLYPKEEIDNAWFGISFEDCDSIEQHDRGYWINQLYKDLGVHTWMSIEPLLEDISPYIKKYCNYIDVIVCGGETGVGARYCKPSWIADIYYLCQNYHIPFYFKSWGKNKKNLSVPGTIEELLFLSGSIISNKSEIETTKELPWANEDTL